MTCLGHAKRAWTKAIARLKWPGLKYRNKYNKNILISVSLPISFTDCRGEINSNEPLFQICRSWNGSILWTCTSHAPQIGPEDLQ